MSRFVFSLQALLRQREVVERDHQLVVAGFERNRAAIESRIIATQSEVRSHKEDLRALLGGEGASGRKGRAVDTRTVRLQANAALSAQIRTQHLAIKLSGVYERLHKAQSLLREASAARRAVELLRDKHFERWKREQAKREANEMDELGTMRAKRETPGS